MPVVYPSLAVGASRRLALFRKEAARPGWARPLTWRDVRFATLESHTGFDEGREGRRSIWYSHNSALPRERFADECNGGPDHEGWFTDEDCNEKARGIVARLPHGRFVAGYYWSSSGERVYFPDVFGNERDAARAADRHAERFADSAREDSERFNAMTRAEGHAESVESDVRNAIAARNVSAYWREHCRDRIEELRVAREDVKRAREAYEKG